MSVLEDLTRADDWALRYGLWAKLFIGDNLFQGLLQSDLNNIDVVVATIDQCNDEAQVGDKRPEWEWITAQCLITCAQVAYLTEGASERLQQILSRLNNRARVPAQMNSNWQQFIKAVIYKFPWPEQLSAEWAWDGVTTFWKDRRRIIRSVQMAVLLLEGDTGITADLTLELIDDGRGVLYPDPEIMSFILRGDTFKQAEQNAVAFVRNNELWPKTKDVRWKIARKSHSPIFELDGGSAGGAFALGLAKLLTNE